MRSARVADYWRHATERDRGFGLVRLTVSDKAPLHAVDIDMANGLTVICGLNGVGKSTVLRLVEGTLNGRDSIASRTRQDLLEGGAATLELLVDNSPLTRSLGQEPIDGPGRAIVIDAFDLCARSLEVARQPNLSDLTDVVEPRVWTDDERSIAGYVVGRTYRSVLHYEIENPTPLEEGFSDDVLPYFKVDAGGVQYDSLSMGMGELASLAALWRLQSVEPQSVLIIEEPETFLSSRATASLLDVVAKEIDNRRLYALVSTHSPDVIARVPLSSLRLVNTLIGTAGVAISTPRSHAYLGYALGSLVGQTRLVVTEDTFASVIVRELLGRFEGVWGQGIDVQAAGDAHSVEELCRRLPRSRTMRVVGILDGDQPLPELPDNAWPVLLLPGGDDPNDLLQQAAVDRVNEFAVILRRDPLKVSDAIQALAGIDPHDWFPEMARVLQLEEPTVIRAACDCWLSSDAVLAEAAEFTKQLTNWLSA